jgi:hypothetical protein
VSGLATGRRAGQMNARRRTHFFSMVSAYLKKKLDSTPCRALLATRRKVTCMRQALQPCERLPNNSRFLVASVPGPHIVLARMHACAHCWHATCRTASSQALPCTALHPGHMTHAHLSGAAGVGPTVDSPENMLLSG